MTVYFTVEIFKLLFYQYIPADFQKIQNGYYMQIDLDLPKK